MIGNRNINVMIFLVITVLSAVRVLQVLSVSTSAWSLLVIIPVACQFLACGYGLKAALRQDFQTMGVAGWWTWVSVLGIYIGNLILDLRAERANEIAMDMMWMGIALFFILFDGSSGGNRKRALELLGDKSRALRDRMVSTMTDRTQPDS